MDSRRRRGPERKVLRYFKGRKNLFPTMGGDPMETNMGYDIYITRRTTWYSDDGSVFT